LPVTGAKSSGAVEQLVLNTGEEEIIWTLLNHIVLIRGVIDVTNLSHMVEMVSFVYHELPREGVGVGGADSCEYLLDLLGITRMVTLRGELSHVMSVLGIKSFSVAATPMPSAAMTPGLSCLLATMSQYRAAMIVSPAANTLAA
jgi:hypothetical protein